MRTQIRMFLWLLMGLLAMAQASFGQVEDSRNGEAKLPDFRSVSNPTPGTIARNPIDGTVMVYIPEGKFIMGTDPDDIEKIWQKFRWPAYWKQYAKDESPKHQVSLDGFWMYKHEITVAQYRKFCQETGRQMPPLPKWGWKKNHPIVNVSWDDAVAYCEWAGVQLPTEAQWEYAARGGNTGLNGKPRYLFVWGDELPKGKGGPGNLPDESFKADEMLKYLKKVVPDWSVFEGYDDRYVHAAPVGSFKPNTLGLYDMAGNVWEWCADWYDAKYYPSSPNRNPQGPASGTWRVLRGGSWGTDPSGVRAANRNWFTPDGWLLYRGFRGSSPRFPR